jgi:ABC-type nickel/cobalt efflux system permease component RcnA
MILGFSVAALLSGAWWLSKLRGVGMQAILTTAATLAAVILVCLGLWWMRHDARLDERAACTAADLAAELEAHRLARSQGEITLRARQLDLEHSRGVINELERKLEELRRESKNPDAVVVPPGDPWLRGGADQAGTVGRNRNSARRD